MGVVAAVLAVIGLVLALGWGFLMFFALAMGSPGPSLIETLIPLAPTIGGGLLAAGAMVMFVRSRPGIALALAVVSLVPVPIMFALMT